MLNDVVEVWKDIQGHEGRYQVSNLGNVQSLDRIYLQKSSHGSMMIKRYYGRKMKPTDNGNGYKIVSLRNGSKRQSCYVHRLVAEAFIPNPNAYKEINHKDYNKTNNAVSNLEWVDRKTNINYSLKNMEKPRAKSKKTITGEKYITRRNGKWRFSIRTKKIGFDRLYNTLEEAVAAREVVIGGKGQEHYAG